MSGTAILVHGAWSSPADWQWVRDALPHDVHVEAVDLHSHHRSHASRADDVAQLTETVTAATPPVVVVGWSYGGAVLTDLPADDLKIQRLIYVASIPGLPPDDPATPAPDAPADVTHVLFHDDGTMVLDNDWFLTSDPAVASMPDHVIDHLRAHPRRPMSLTAILEPATRAAWRHIPTTVILGAADELIPGPQRRWALEHIPDTRIIDCDHFIPLRQPHLIAATITETLQAPGTPTADT